MDYFNSCLADISPLFGETERYVLLLLSLYRLGLLAQVCNTAQKYSAFELHTSEKR